MDMKKVALFDLDGVVIDTEGQYTEFWETIGKRYCPEIPDFALRIKGMALVQILASQASLQAHEKEIRRAIDEFELGMDYPYIAGALEFLWALREAGVPRAVVTSSNRAKMENVYRVHPEFRTLFDRVFAADDITRSKPAPDCYVNAAHCMGVGPAGGVGVGGCVGCRYRFRPAKSGEQLYFRFYHFRRPLHPHE